MTKGIEDLFFRYGEVIKDPRVSIKGLEVIVNDRKAFPFFEKLMKKYNIPGRVVERK